MNKRLISLFVATIITVTAGVFAPAVTASVLITENNVKTYTNYLDKAGTGTITGVEGTGKTTQDGKECHSDYNVEMTTGTAYAYIGDTSIRDIKADSYGWAHLKFSISDAVNFVLEFKLQYNSTSNSRKTTSLFNMNNYANIAGTQQSPKPYTVDILFDLSGAKAYSFFNGIRKDEAVEASLPDISYLRQLQLTNYSGASTHSYNVTGLLLEALPKDATYTDVLSYLTDSSAPIDYEKGTYFEGINVISGSDNISYGSMYLSESASSVTGDNTDGYSLSDTADGGFYRYFLFNNKDSNGEGMPAQSQDSIVRHSVLICPESGDKTVSVGKYGAGEEDVLFFDANNSAILDKNGNTILADYDKDKFYQFDLFFNNKDHQYSVYLDSKEVDSGTLGCVPVGYISYKNGAANQSMILKNIFTKIYPLGTSMKTVTGDIYGTAYIELEDFTVLKTKNGGYEISAAAVFNNVSKNYTDAKIIYALLRNGAPVEVGGAAVTDEMSVTNDEINLSYDEIDRKYPYGLLKTEGITINKGDTLTLRAWLISGEISGNHLIDSNEVSFTAE